MCRSTISDYALLNTYKYCKCTINRIVRRPPVTKEKAKLMKCQIATKINLNV